VRTLRAAGVTIILTTHYIEEAEEMADRVGVINKGELILVENKAELMRKLGKKQLILHLPERLAAIRPRSRRIVSRSRPTAATSSIPTTPERPHRHHGFAGRSQPRRHPVQGYRHHQSSLEDIFVDLVRQG